MPRLTCQTSLALCLCLSLLTSCAIGPDFLRPESKVSAQWLGQAPTAPVVSPRGVINAFTQTPAPTTVAAGGLIWINGLNLGPVDAIVAKDAPWPTSVGDPAIQVLINNRPSPIYSAGPSRIVAQVPYEIANGQVNLVVRRGDAQSRPARFNVINIFP